MNRLCVLSMILLLGACQKSETPKEALPPAGLAGSAHTGTSIQLQNASPHASLPASTDKPIEQGTVVEMIPKSGYSYVRITKADGGEAWLALVEDQPKVGEKIRYQEQAVLTDFHSKSLDRKFDQIIFANLVKKSQ